jgi:hypothetical protein
MLVYDIFGFDIFPSFCLTFALENVFFGKEPYFLRTQRDRSQMPKEICGRKTTTSSLNNRIQPSQKATDRLQQLPLSYIFPRIPEIALFSVGDIYYVWSAA